MITRMHYSDVIMSAMTSQTSSFLVVYSTVCSGADHKKHQHSVSIVFVGVIHPGPANSPHKGPIMRKMLPFDYVIIDLKCEVRHIPNLTLILDDHFFHYKWWWIYITWNTHEITVQCLTVNIYIYITGTHSWLLKSQYKLIHISFKCSHQP